MAALEIRESELSGFDGKVVFVTGGSRGLGLGTCLTFLSLGATVISGDLRPPQSPVQGLEYVQCDITNWANLCAAMRQIIDKHAKLDVFVANAGVGEVEDFFSDEIDETTGMLKEPRHAVVDVDLKGTMNCAKVAVHQMKKQKTGGAIVFTGSTASYLDERRIPAYMAAKHGVCDLILMMTLTILG